MVKGKNLLGVTMSLGPLVLLMATSAFAGQTGTEFEDVYVLIKGWTSGYLGKTLAVGAFLTGMAIGVVRQSLMSIALGVGSGLAIHYTPSVVESIAQALF